MEPSQLSHPVETNNSATGQPRLTLTSTELLATNSQRSSSTTTTMHNNPTEFNTTVKDTSRSGRKYSIKELSELRPTPKLDYDAEAFGLARTAISSLQRSNTELQKTAMTTLQRTNSALQKLLLAQVGSKPQAKPTVFFRQGTQTMFAKNLKPKQSHKMEAEKRRKAKQRKT